MKTNKLRPAGSGPLSPLGREAAFSLVEVVLAIGVFSFCLLILVALVPVGLAGNRISRERILASDLCSSLESDLRGTPVGGSTSPLDSIKFPTPSGSSYITATTTLYDAYTPSGTVTFSTTRSPLSQYCFTLTLTSPPTNTYPAAPVQANIQATWPAAANPSAAGGAVTSSVAISRF